jgi:enoyl-CoA hydratase
MRLGNVEYDKKGKVAVLRFDEEKKLNALTPGIRKGLREGLSEIENDDEIRIAVLTGTGRAFCAGFDIETLQATKFEVTAVKRMLREEFFDIARKIEKHPKPIIAAVNGLCLGGGLEMAICCDTIISSDKARFGTPEINIGILPGFAIVRLQQIIGGAKAKKMIMTGEPIPAEEAYRLNLVDTVVPHDKLMEEAMALAEKIAEKPAVAIQLAKSVVNREIGAIEYAYAMDSNPFLFATEDGKEGVSAFIEKRKPVFKGK